MCGETECHGMTCLQHETYNDDVPKINRDWSQIHVDNFGKLYLSMKVTFRAGAKSAIGASKALSPMLGNFSFKSLLASVAAKLYTAKMGQEQKI